MDMAPPANIHTSTELISFPLSSYLEFQEPHAQLGVASASVLPQSFSRITAVHLGINPAELRVRREHLRYSNQVRNDVVEVCASGLCSCPGASILLS